MSRSWNGKEIRVGKDEREHEEQLEGEATVLPAREAMSLISPDPGVGFVPEMQGVAAADAQGSTSGEENTSGDRDEHLENSDSASSQT